MFRVLIFDTGGTILQKENKSKGTMEIGKQLKEVVQNALSILDETKAISFEIRKIVERSGANLKFDALFSIQDIVNKEKDKW